MSETATCVVASEGGRIHGYIAGTLEHEAVAEFEVHLLGCMECQQAVREGVAVAAALRRVSASVVDPVAPRRRRRWWSVPLAAAAAVGVLWLVVGRADPLARLGRVAEAPAFAGVSVRGDGDSVNRLADSGMAAYRAENYRQAARLLGSVPSSARTPALSFYHGLAVLMSGDPASAIQVLRNVPDGSAYAAEARYYRAKAWLQTGKGDSALVQLAAVPAGTIISAPALALADSVRMVAR